MHTYISRVVYIHANIFCIHTYIHFLYTYIHAFSVRCPLSLRVEFQVHSGCGGLEERDSLRHRELW